MNRTSLLVLILSALLLIHYYPGLATPIWLLALAGGGVWLLSTARKYYRYVRQGQAKAAQQVADEREYRDYETAVAALRAQHSRSPDELEAQLAALQLAHRPMLDRRFGTH